MSLTVHVIGHTAREPQARQLAAHLGAQLWLDSGTLGVYGNHRRALVAAAETNASHALILEDDALPCVDVLGHARRLIELRPDHLIGLYVGRQRPRLVQPDIVRAIAEADEAEKACFLLASQTEKACFPSASRTGKACFFLPLQTGTLRWGVGYLAPLADMAAMLARADSLPTWAADRRIGAWHGVRGRLSYAWPSLVDHADGLSLSQEHGPRQPGRVAWRTRPLADVYSQ